MAKFKPGDIVLIKPTANAAENVKHYVGQEATIVEYIGEAPWIKPSNYHSWYKLERNGETFYADEGILEKRRPPKEDLGSWDEIRRTVGYSPRLTVGEAA